MDPRSDGLTSTQKGSITEFAVASALMLGSNGRLSAFTPLADDHGVDLIIFDKRTGAMLPAQVKSWMGLPERRSTIQFDVQKKTFDGNVATILIAVLFDAADASIRMSWMMPLEQVPDNSISQTAKYALRPSVRPDTSDRYRAFRHDSLESLVQAVIRRVENERTAVANGQVSS